MELTASLMDTALALSEKDRAELAYQLLLSLKDAEPGADIEQAWAEEIRGRIKEFRQDRSIAQDFGEAMMEVRTSLKTLRGKQSP